MAQKDYMSSLEEWFGKLPALPKGGREGLVMITPWVALVFGVLGVLAGLAGVGLLTAFSPFMYMGGYHSLGGSLVIAVLGLLAAVLLLMGFPGTKARKMQGWMMIFYSEVVSLVIAVVSISLSSVLVSLIAFYLLFQIKSYYK